MKKKFFAVLMALCMVLSLGNISALAADAEGTKANPKEITTLGETASQAASETTVHDEAGYWYKYTAPFDGYLAVTSMTSSVDGAYTATKIINTSADNEETTGLNEKAMASEGDVLLIQVRSYKLDSTTWAPIFDAATITWEATYAEIGTADSPDTMELDYSTYSADGSVTVTPGADGYYFTCEAVANGMFYMYILDYATTATNPEIILTNGENVVKYSESTETKTITTMIGSDTYKIVEIPVNAYEEVLVQVKDNGTGTAPVDILWHAAIEEPVGAASNPYVIDEFTTTVTLPASTMMTSTTYFKVPYAYLNLAEAMYVRCDDPSSLMVAVGGGMGMPEQFALSEDGQVTTSRYGSTLIQAMENQGTGPVFSIMNGNYEDVECTIEFVIPEGVSINPDVLEDEGTCTFEADANPYDFYYYTWTAPADGIVTFSGETETAGQFSVENSSAGYYGATLNCDGEDKDILDVNKGDVLTIYVSALDENDAVVAGDVTIKADFVEVAGGVVAPEELEDALNAIKSAINNDTPLAEDEIPVVNMCDEDLENTLATVVPAQLLAAVMEYNEAYDTDLTVALVMAEYIWYINGVEDTTPIDLGITFDTKNTPEATIEAIADGDEYTTFSIAHDGEFGFDATLAFFVNVEENPSFVGKTVALYWDNNGTLELVGEKCEIGEDGIIGFAMDHASDYVMVIEGTATTETPGGNTDTNPGGNTDTNQGGNTVTPPVTGDTTNAILWIAVLGLGVVAIAGSVVMRKREF